LRINKNILQNTRPINSGFKIEIDKAQNIYFYKEEAKRTLRIGIPYSRQTNEIFTLSSSISFHRIQSLYVETCYPIISKNSKVTLKGADKKEQLNNATINTGKQIETPDGILNSRFKNIEIEKDTNPKEMKIMQYVNDYYSKSAEPFFTEINSITKLDKLTDNLSIYELSLYLTNVPMLKKILLKRQIDKEQAKYLLNSYRNKLTENKGNKMVELLLDCLKNINQIED